MKTGTSFSLKPVAVALAVLLTGSSLALPVVAADKTQTEAASVARYQGWEMPYTLDRAEQRMAELVPLTAENRRAVGDLATHKSQERFVTPMAGSFRDALVPPSRDGATVVPWYRAIEADGDIVGFVLASEMTDHHVNPLLWEAPDRPDAPAPRHRLGRNRPVRSVVPGSGREGPSR